MDALSRADEFLLISILRLGENATGVTIIEELAHSTGKQITVGALWVQLDILAKKGLIEKRMENPGPEGGRKKIFYTLTRIGLEVLEYTCEMQRKLYRGLTPMIEKAK